MNANPAYEDLAAAYVEGVRGLLRPPVAPPGALERGEAAPRPTVDQAESLAAISAQLTAAAAQRLEDEAEERRTQAALGLLAKATTDLEISAALLLAAEDEEAGAPPSVFGAPERGAGPGRDLEERLALILGQESAMPPAVDRSAPTLPADPAKARQALAMAAGDTLDLIRQRSAKTGQAAMAGLLAIGAMELATAAGVVGLNIGTALGQAEKVTRLYTMFQEFAINAYDSILALLGPGIAKVAATKVVEWVNDVLQGEQFAALLEKLYETAPAREDLSQRLQDSQAGSDQVATAQTGLDALEARHKKQCDLADKVVQGLGFLAAAPAAILPQGQVLRAAAYIVLAGYIVLSGADYVDAPRLKQIDRVAGVRKVVEAIL
jgi:hypothetical protein